MKRLTVLTGVLALVLGTATVLANRQQRHKVSDSERAKFSE